MKIMSEQNRKLIVTGDYSLDRYIYLEGLQDNSADSQGSLLKAKRIWTETVRGDTGSTIECLSACGYDAFDPFTIREPGSESVYILTGQGPKGNKKWRIAQAFAADRKNLPCLSTDIINMHVHPLSIPAIFIDADHSDLMENRNRIRGLFESRPYMVQTCDPRKPEWASLRAEGLSCGLWLSSLSDMSDGALSFAGTWENIHDRLLKYLRADSTLWADNHWKQWIVVRIHSDGVIAFGPAAGYEEGLLLIFAGDQPGSFAREGNGAVTGGRSFLTAALADALYDIGMIRESLQMGLSLLRRLNEEGYVGPPPGTSDWKLEGSTNLPTYLFKAPRADNILQYNRRPPESSWDSVCKVVGGAQEDLRTVTVLNMGNLATCCPSHAETLLRFESRLKNHVRHGKGVLSFTIFGGPGSGKSFVAQELAKAVDPEGKLFQNKIFNISQFGEPSRLIDALQSVQAIGLQGKIPFILWDEFDTTHQGAQAGWLPYFLMPMQDAKFFDGSYDIALGKCIFVFIGGTFSGENEFREWAMNSKEGKRLKGIDFHSRLDSALMVPSVDLPDDNSNAWLESSPAKLVRALMIRNFLKKYQKVEAINQDLLAYLIHARLQHGVRSLERIITSSELGSASVFEPYHLPPVDVLQIHVRGLNPEAVDPVKDFVHNLSGYDIPKDAPPLELKWKK